MMDSIAYFYWPGS